MESRFKKLLLNQEPISPEKYSEYDENEPRNVLASAVNPVLDQYVNPGLEKLVGAVNKYSPVEIAGNVRIPEVSKGDRLEWERDFAQNAATGMIGGIKAVNSQTMSPAAVAIKESMENRLRSIIKADDAMPGKSEAILELTQSIKNIANTGSTSPAPLIKTNNGTGRFGKIIVKP